MILAVNIAYQNLEYGTQKNSMRQTWNSGFKSTLELRNTKSFSEIAKAPSSPKDASWQ